jgi:hypothetical protein
MTLIPRQSIAGRLGSCSSICNESQDRPCCRLEVGLRATTDGLRGSPHRLGAVKAQNIQPIFEGLDTGLDIIYGAFAVVAATVTEVWGACCVPYRRPCSVDTNRISILHQGLETRMISVLNASHAKRYQLQ